MSSETSPQSAILAEGSKFAFYGTYSVDYDSLEKPLEIKKFLQVVKSFPDILKDVTKRYDAPVAGSISFGKKLWTFLTKDNADLKGAGLELFDFPGYGGIAPSTQCDLYLHIHSIVQPACYEGAQTLLELMGPLVKLSDSKQGFMWRDSRDLTGFIDGTENPKGDKKRSSAALDGDGSSYVIVQRFIHHLDRWKKLDVTDQEQVIGRTKEESVEIEDKKPWSHVSRSDLKGIKIVRHSLPYAYPGDEEIGLWFTAYCKNMYGHDEIQKSLYGTRDGTKDALCTDFISPVTGGYYFTPCLKFIEML